MMIFSAQIFIFPPILLISRLLRLCGKEGKFSKTFIHRYMALKQIQKIPPCAPYQKVYWFHAASGEIEYAKPVMRELKILDPSCIILWSYSSISALDFFSSVVDVDFKFPLPFDTPGNIRQLLRSIKPKAFLIARSDLWPELLYQLKELNIPRFLFAATISPTKASRTLNQNLFNLLSHISCVSDEDLANTQTMKTQATLSKDGDPRADQVYYRAKNTQLKASVGPLLKYKNILLLGSTWPEDELALRKIFQIPNWSFVIVPHEWSPQKRSYYTELLSGKKIGFLSEVQLNSDVNLNAFDIIVVDYKGILADLYQQATAVFVGGSFKEKVHSVFEPLAWNKRVFVGPFYHNNREATEFATMQNLNQYFVTPIQSGENLFELLQNVTPQDLENLAPFIQKEMQKKLGASSRLAKKVLSL